MSEAKGVATPLSSSDLLYLNDQSGAADATNFRRIVGSLQYLQIIRPDVSFVVNKLSQFMHQSTIKHFQALKGCCGISKTQFIMVLFLDVINLYF